MAREGKVALIYDDECLATWTGAPPDVGEKVVFNHVSDPVLTLEVVSRWWRVHGAAGALVEERGVCFVRTRLSGSLPNGGLDSRSELDEAYRAGYEKGKAAAENEALQEAYAKGYSAGRRGF